METVTLDIEDLVQHISKIFRTKQVVLEEREGGLFIQPMTKGSGLLGIAANDKLTVDSFIAFKREDKEKDQ